MYWKKRQHSLNCVQTIDLHVSAKKMHSIWQYFSYRSLKWCQVVCKNSGYLFIYYLFICSSHPLSPSLFAFNLSQNLGLFQWVGSSHQVAKVLELQVQHQSFQWIFTIDFLQQRLVWSSCCPKDSSPYHNLKASTLQRSVFFMVQLSHPYMTTGETISLTISTFVGKIMSLLCNTLPLSLLFLQGASLFFKISWLQSVCNDFEA